MKKFFNISVLATGMISFHFAPFAERNGHMNGKLDDFHIDVLNEIGNIGAGNAISALSKMLGKRVDMNVARAKIVDIPQVAYLVGGPENLIFGALVSLSGGFEGFMLFAIDLKDAKRLAGLMVGNEEGCSGLSEMEFSALEELVNILTGTYLAAIASMSGLNIRPSAPMVTMDMAGAILDILAVESGATGDSVIFLGTDFIENDNAINGEFFLIPKGDSYNNLFAALGVV